MFDDDQLITELVQYKCGDCGGDNWILKIGYRSDDRTFLIVTCANKSCVERKRASLGVDKEALIVWDEFLLAEDNPYGEESKIPTDIN